MKNDFITKQVIQMKAIKCERCGIEIEYRARRKYCNKCRREVDDELYILRKNQNGKTKRKRSSDD